MAAFSHVAFFSVARSSARRRPILLVTLGCAAARPPARTLFAGAAVRLPACRAGAGCHHAYLKKDGDDGRGARCGWNDLHKTQANKNSLQQYMYIG
jgi:hypothetical protein